ncbi:hypothetical protein MIR68_005465 [Amoeboaphelidium protococcarum]|nr:hypothetical protein MIR68_005465 [Amoeboaphelidium protococcarum]
MTINASQNVQNRQPLDRQDVIQFVKPMARKHPQRTSIQHWQLRDLVHSPAPNQFVHVNTNNVLLYDTVTKQSNQLIRNLQFSPTSVTTGFGYVAAGGQRSQLVVKQLQGSWDAFSAVGGSINNALCISACPWGSYSAQTSPLAVTSPVNNASFGVSGSSSSSSTYGYGQSSERQYGDVRILICNNDESIKVYSIPGMQRVTTIGLPTAVNYASVSPDGRKLCAVGDSNQVFIYDISTTGYYEKIATLTGSNDAGFGCSWNHSSDKVTVGSQDGVVTVWDIRYMNSNSNSSNNNSGNHSTSTTAPHLGNPNYGKLAVIKSSQHPQVKGAVRAVKFSKCSSVDLLVFSEHVSYVNFIDARTFDTGTASRQSIRLGSGSLSAFNNSASSNIDVHLSGLSFAPDSRSIFVGLENAVLEFDVDTVSRRTFAKGALI